jgi:phosphonate transport system substrate-binding protein
MYRTLAKGIAIVGLMALAVGCQSEETATAVGESVVKLPPERIITLGDIDPKDPAKKIARFQPLAEYLAEHLSDQGVTRGRVVIARDIEEMATFLKDGTSTFTSIARSPL